MFFAITSYINGIASIAIALFVYLKRRETPLGKIFCGLTISIAWYSILLANVVLSPTVHQATLWAKIEHIGVAFIPAVSLHFCLAVIDLDRRKKLLIRLAYLFSIFLILTLPTGWFENGVREIAGLKHYIRPGPLYFAYFLFYVICFVYAEIKLFNCFLSNRKNRLGRQALFVFLASFLGSGAGSVTFLPVFGFNVAPSLNSLVILYVISLAYAILRHGLLDVQVLIKKTLVFAGLFAFVLVLILLPLYVLLSLVMGLPPEKILRWWWVFGLAALAIAVTARRTERFLIDLTDRYLFQKKFRLSTIIAQASQAIALVQSLKWLARRIVAFLVTKGRIKNAVVYVRSDQDHHFARGALRGYHRYEHPPKILNANDPVIRYLARLKRPVEIHQLEEQLIAVHGNSDSKRELQEVVDFFRRTKAEVIIPSFLRRRLGTTGIGKEREQDDSDFILRNILILGGKKSDEPYLEEDLDVFHSLAQESAIAIENARLYDEQIKRRQEIEEADRKLKDMEAQLIQTEKRRVLAEISGGLGHEIRHALTPSTGFIYQVGYVKRDLEKLAQDNSVPPSARKTLEEDVKTLDRNFQSISQMTDRIMSIVDTLRTFVKGQPYKELPEEAKPFKMEKVDFELLMKLAMEHSRFLHALKDMTHVPIELFVEEELPILWGDLNLLLQVFDNLFSNAYDAMKTTPERKIAIHARQSPEDSRFVEIEFKDTGCGISDEIKEKVWEYLYSTKGEEGSGIGLFWCKRIVEDFHGGRIWFESKVGKGTTFFLNLPIYEMAKQGARS